MTRFKLAIPVLFALMLSACETNIVDDSIQKLTLETPGARNAVCYAYVDGYKYKFYPPETRTISKSYEPMEIDCKAPGNRDRKVIIEPTINNVTVAAVTMGDIPATLSNATNNMFYSYPERVEISFVGSTPQPFPLPDHNAPDIKQPEEYRLEEFLPSVPRLNSDRDTAPTVIKKRRAQQNENFAPASGPLVQEPIQPAELAPSDLTQPPRTDAQSTGKADVLDSVETLGAELDPGANLNE